MITILFGRYVLIPEVEADSSGNVYNLYEVRTEKTETLLNDLDTRDKKAEWLKDHYGFTYTLDEHTDYLEDNLDKMTNDMDRLGLKIKRKAS